MLAARHDPAFAPDSYEQHLTRVPRLHVDMAEIATFDERTQLQILNELRAWREALQANPLKGYLAAGRKHFGFHQAKHEVDTRLIAGGNRAGKTTTAVVDDVVDMTPWDLLPRHLWQFKRYECPVRIRVFGTDLERQIRQVIHDKFKEWLPKALLRKGTWDESYSMKGDFLQLECGCMVDFLSYGVDLNKLGGVYRHRIHYDEEPPKAFRGEGLQRLVDVGGDEVFSMTPQQGLTWVYRDVWKHRGRVHPPPPEEGGRAYWGAAIASTDNRNITREEILKALAGVTNEAEKKQRLLGQFAELGGQIYPNFLTRLVSLFRPEALRGQDIYCGIDPGIRFAGLVWVAFDRDNQAVVFAARKLQDTSADQFPRHFKEVAARWGFDPNAVRYVIDPSARNRELATGVSVQGILNALGWNPSPGQNDVFAGIQQVRRRLNDGALLIGDWLTDLHDEAIEYAFEDREDEVDQVKKRNDHLLDPLRYVCMERIWEPRGTSGIWVPPGADVAYGPTRREAPGSIAGAMV